MLGKICDPFQILFVYKAILPQYCTSIDISTCLLASPTEFWKQDFENSTCPNGQVDFLNTAHCYIENDANTKKYANNGVLKLEEVE